MNILAAIGGIINTINEKADKIAKDKEFLIRKGKIEPLTFILALTLCLADLHEITLKTILRKCENIQDGLKISKQALFKRMKAGSKLMEEMYVHIFNETSKNMVKTGYIKDLNQFTNVYLTDATTISLPDKLEQVYKGLGGKNANSALKIQTTYSLLQQKITSLDIVAATQNDTKNNQVTIDNIKTGELYIKDLGYYNGEYFFQIEAKQAYYLSRIKTNTKLFKYDTKEEKYVEIDYCKLYKSVESYIDTELFIKLKNKQMLKVRFVCIKLPEEIISTRLCKANKSAKCNGKMLTKKEKLMLRWNVFITNVKSEMLDAIKICKLYRVRWQLELVFKAIKSSLSFDNFGFAGEHYFKCLLYGKLILLTTSFELFAMCRKHLYREVGRLVSIQSFLRNLRLEINVILEIVMFASPDKLSKLSERLKRIAELSLYDKRNRKTSEEELIDKNNQPIDIKELRQIC